MAVSTFFTMSKRLAAVVHFPLLGFACGGKLVVDLGGDDLCWHVKMSFSSMRFGQFCDFRPKVCFSASGSKRFETLPFSSGSLTLSIFLC
ncbi:hypothetical protein HanXRQr2_Chr01g0040201 [Helianthus annuus]|uniref:Secreted protein n=1 Tax=Helianthus annuus TaxID=4232 RepID=A0A9K3P4Y1_HELAN|nr:hypothetical protein HanXRQr2_Chr01g0040201 [Helianthus annuus]